MHPTRAHRHVTLAATVGLVLLTLGLALPAAVEGACRWTFDCSSGQCRQVQVCDSTIDVPAIRPPAVPPIAPPSVRPIPVPVVPPIGTSQCRQAYLCDNAGQCSWQTVCR